jgi:hypothetical protein
MSYYELFKQLKNDKKWFNLLNLILLLK